MKGSPGPAVFCDMDKIEQKIEQLTQRVRRLEMESLPASLPVQEVRDLMDDLDLEPAPFHCGELNTSLRDEDILALLQENGYSCHQGEDFVCVETEDGKVYVNYDRLPIISITNGYRFEETEEGVNSIRRAAYEVTGAWDMVKAIVDPSEGHLLIYLNARHEDVASFHQNIRFYIEQVVEATKELKERYHNYERDRMLRGYKPSSKYAS